MNEQADETSPTRNIKGMSSYLLMQSSIEAYSDVHGTLESYSPMDNTDSDAEDERNEDSSNRRSPSAGKATRTVHYPGRKDPRATADVEKCLAFYDQIRDHFDDDVAAMLLKCCLCYGDCSGRK